MPQTKQFRGVNEKQKEWSLLSLKCVTHLVLHLPSQSLLRTPLDLLLNHLCIFRVPFLPKRKNKQTWNNDNKQLKKHVCTEIVTVWDSGGLWTCYQLLNCSYLIVVSDSVRCGCNLTAGEWPVAEASELSAPPHPGVSWLLWCPSAPADSSAHLSCNTAQLLETACK